METKSGIYTTEFWITAIVNIAAAVIAILAARGAISGEEGELWVQLVQALAMAIAPIVMAIVTSQYIESRATIKQAVSRAKSMSEM